MCELQNRCVKCKEWLPATTDFFNAAPTRKSGLDGCCKACRAEARLARLGRAPMRRAHVSDALAPLLTGRHFLQGAALRSVRGARVLPQG